MMDPTLDFRFAWRWLLQRHDLKHVALFGFDKTETGFWQEVLSPSEICCDGHEADTWIVDADRYPLDSTLDRKSLESANVICAVGNCSAVMRWSDVLGASFPDVREYGMLPPSAPRVVVPLDSHRNAAIGLGLHRPGRWCARLLVGVSRLLAGAGIYTPLRRRMLLIAVRKSGTSPESLLQAGVLARLNEVPLNYAMYLGTADTNRKTVVLPLGVSKPETILKIAESPAARESLKHESAVLESLRGSAISDNVPQLSGLIENEHALTMLQEYRLRRTVFFRQLDQEVTDFLARLSLINRDFRPLDSILEEILPGGAMPTARPGSSFVMALYKRLQSLAAAGMMVWVHRSHGDFAPWNCSLTDQGLFVFDWENSQERETAFADVFYYVVAPALHIAGKSDIPKVRCSALARAADVAACGGLAIKDARLYWALWLLKRSVKEYHPLYELLLEPIES